ncbi:MAG: hypothetical protein AAGI07_19715, partial [Bacteroidota bacterium]
MLFLFATSSLFAQYSEKAFEERASLFINQTADNYAPPGMKNLGDPEKYYWPKAIARFEKYGIEDSLSNAWVTEMKDNPPFHFTLLGMTRLFYLYSEAPALKQHRFTILQEVFKRTDNYNAWTSEGTENHIGMSRTSGYLFAQAALEDTENFPEASKRLGEMKNWCLDWAEKVLQHGTGEWNSAIYTAYNLYGWLNLYDFAKDESVKTAAKLILDYYATEIALHYSFGIIGGAEMRGNGALNGDFTATRYLAWLWFGNTIQPPKMTGSQYIQTLHAVTGSYRPPLAIVALAHKKVTLPIWVTGSKPSYLFEKASFVKQYFYADSSFTLGTVVSPYGGWTGGNYQLVNWKLVAKGNSPEPLQISGNGAFFDEFSGKARNPFTQYFQHKNVFIQLTKQPKDVESLTQKAVAITTKWGDKWLNDFSIRFPNYDRHQIVNFNKNIISQNTSFLNFPSTIELIQEDEFCFVQLPNTYLAIRLLGDLSTISIEEKKIKKDRRKILSISASSGKTCGYILEAFNGTA